MDAGTLIGARYRLDRRLATGGMGAVWVAQDELLGRPVALKLLHQNLAEDEGFRRRFRTEARAAARVSHPGVVAVYDYGEDADLTFLAMELVPGESLHEMLRRRGPLSSEETMRIVAQAADALSDAHALGLVHRDVKPANLLVEPNGTVKVTDFGIVRAAGMTTATVDGSVLGTVAYMSPEQIRGERVGPASDVYSLGVVAYEALAGTRPFPAEESIAVALAHLHDPVPPLPDTIPPSVGALVALMLRKEPDSRPTARRVAAQAGLLAVDPISAGPATMPMAPITATWTEPGNGPTISADRGPGAATGATEPTAAPPGSRPPAGEGTTRPTPFRTLRAALGAAAIAANGRDARRHASVGVVSAVVLAALLVALLLAAALPGSGPGGGESAASQRRVHHTAAVNTAASSTTTSTSPTTTTSTTSPVLATTQPTTAPGPGHGPPGGPAPGGPGPGAPGPGGPGHGGPGPGGPAGPGH